jgi:hypothetical protein
MENGKGRRNRGRILVVLASFSFTIFGLGLTSIEQKDSSSGVLSASDKADLAEALRLKKELGDRVWPGLSGFEVPVILYDDTNEFLLGDPKPPAGWAVVDGDDFLGGRYYRRAAVDPQAFAVPVGTRWAASVTSREYMNKTGPFRIAPELYAVMVLHEVFHAFQAVCHPSRFAKMKAVYASEDRYPFKDPEFVAAWNREGAVLAEASRSKDHVETARLAERFLDLRAARRARFVLDASLLDFERELEWLEGLAEFVEIRFYEIAHSRAGEPAYSRYKPPLPMPLQNDFFRLERALGAQSGDLRFYLSGMALARLLDRLRPGWMSEAMKDDYSLDDLLRGALFGREKPAS